MMKYLLEKILRKLAAAAIRRHHPLVIGITGSVGKTSAKEAIFHVLKHKYKVRTSEKNYNNEIGLPLTIIGLPHYGKNILAWTGGILRTLCSLATGKPYPEMLVLEYGIDHPGDMDKLLSIARPNLAVVTAIGDIPVHVEFFRNPEEVIQEKAKLVRALPSDGLAVLNHDDDAVLDMKNNTKAHVSTFGFDEHAEIKISNFQFLVFKDAGLGDIPDGISFKIGHQGHMVPFRIHKAFGEAQAYAAAVAAAVGVHFGINLVEISDALREYTPPAGRMRLLGGVKKSFILDDTYNAAPEAMRRALDTLKSLPGKRKIAVLGDMLEIGKYTEQVHRAVGDQAAGFVDLLVTVGSRANFIADEASAKGVKNIIKFDDSTGAGKELDRLIEAGDLILVKGSQSMRMEKAVEEIMANPERAKDLLVRQEKYWTRQ